MDKNTKRAICVMVIGKKYERQFAFVKPQFEAYALKCSASLHVIDQIPDPTFHRPLLAQKLLIPEQMNNYDLVLFLDLDILISHNAPNIFCELTQEKSFAAILDARGSDEFIQTWKSNQRIINETNLSYFTSRNFEPSSKLQGCINGGVFLFRPNKVAKLFREYYYSDHDQGPFGSYEETPMAYYTQTNDMFQALDSRYNLQIMYKLKGTTTGQKIVKNEKKIPKILRRLYYKAKDCRFIPLNSYKDFARKSLKDCYFLHFAGNYPYYFDFTDTIKQKNTL